MNVSDDVIQDLLPLYRSGLASPDSAALVAEWLAAHPDFTEADGALQPPPSDVDALRALSAARRLSRWRRRLYGVSIGLTVLLLTTRLTFEQGHLVAVHLVALELPGVFGPIALSAAAGWYGYWRLSARVHG
jgi:hypothetical protein